MKRYNCPLKDDWKNYSIHKQEDMQFVVCPACGAMGCHVELIEQVQTHSEQDALDALYNAVERLQKHGCDLPYMLQEVESAYRLFATTERRIP